VKKLKEMREGRERGEIFEETEPKCVLKRSLSGHVNACTNTRLKSHIWSFLELVFGHRECPLRTQPPGSHFLLPA
jgi:hypothetical protein